MQRKAEPGESTEETRLYSPFTTSAASLSEWGIAVDSYFSSLKMIALLFLVAGVMNWYNLRFFASSDYSPEREDSLDNVLKGSAVCVSDALMRGPILLNSFLLTDVPPGFHVSRQHQNG